MSADSQPCPSDERWRCFLTEALPAAEEATLTAHLDGCPACQKGLDSMAAGADALPALAREVGKDDPTMVKRVRPAAPRAGAEPANPPGDDAAPPARPRDPDLPFLRPPERPDSLG